MIDPLWQEIIEKINTRSFAAAAGLLLVTLGLVLAIVGIRKKKPSESADHRITGEFLGLQLNLNTGSLGTCLVFLGVLMLSLVTLAEMTGGQKIQCADVTWEGDRFVRNDRFYRFIQTLCQAPGSPPPIGAPPVSGGP
jgi:hypothetical protein